MDPRTTTSGATAASTPGAAAAPGRDCNRGDCRGRTVRSRRRPGLYLGLAVAGAVLAHVLVGTAPVERAEADTPASVAVAEQLGLTARSAPVDVTADLAPLAELAASRSTRESAQAAAAQAQAAAEQAELDRQQAEADAAAQAAAEAAAAAAAAEAEAAAEAAAAEAAAAVEEGGDEDAPAATSSSMSASAVARISNGAGTVRPQTQAAANAVVSSVPGADGITIGGTRASATDPGGHPSGLALDYMVGSDISLGNAIVDFQIANWDELGVDYVIYRQRMLSSPGGSWKPMEDRGSPTANHMDHPHVNYRG